MFFIVGLPRSGTTLLSSLLSSSEDVKVTPELWFFNYWVKQYSFLNFEVEEEFGYFLTKFFQSKRFKYLGLDANAVRGRIDENPTDRSFRAVFKACLDEFRETTGAKHVGEKTPGQYRNIGELLKAFPDSRIICMMRDPRAVACSLINVPFGSNYVSITARRWRNYARTLLTAQHDERIMVVKYEDLVHDPRKSLEAICEFMGWTDVHFKIDEDRKGHFTGARRDDWSAEHFDKANAPVDKGSMEKWKTDLSKVQIATIDDIAGNIAEKFGYSRHTDSVGRSARSLHVLTEKISSKVEYFIRNPNKLRNKNWYRRLEYSIMGDNKEKN